MFYNIKRYFNLDFLGFSASFICAIHCATMPLLITILSTSSLAFIVAPKFEIFIIFTSLIIGILSLLPSYLNKHRNLKPIIFLIVGILLIFIGHVFFEEKFEAISSSLGAFIISYSHFFNFRLLKQINCCALVDK